LFPGHSREIERLGSGAPINIFLQGDFRAAFPAGVTEQGTVIPVNNVVLEGEGEVWLGSCECDLALFTEGQDVVAKNILFPVMLVHTAVTHVINQVVFIKDARAAFIGIQTPAPITGGVNVVDDVIPDNSSL